MVFSVIDILILVVVVLGLSLGQIIFWRDRTNKTHAFYTFFVTFLSLFVLSVFFENKSDWIGLAAATFFVRADFIFGLLFAHTWFKFCGFFVESTLIFYRWLRRSMLALVMALILGIFFTEYVLHAITFTDGIVEFQIGPLWFVYALYILLTLSGGLSLLAVAWYRSGKEKKNIVHRQLGFIIIGFLISIGSAVVTFLFVQTFTGISQQISETALVGVIAVMTLTAYAIIRYRLFEIKVVLAHAFVGILMMTLFIQPLTAETLSERGVEFSIFVLGLIFSILLVHALNKEIAQRKRVEKVIKQLRNFVSFATHELRGPVANFRGAISMIFEGDYGVIPTRFDGIMKRLFMEADGMGQTIDTFLALNKIEVGEFKLNAERNDIVELITTAIDEVKYQAEHKNVYIHFNGPSELSFDFDSYKIRNVIRNLLDNAVKYNKHNGKIWVTLEEDGATREVVFRVKDTGQGISEDAQEKLFKKYARAKKKTPSGSTIESHGIGLWLVKEMMDLHKGRITVYSEGTGKGATFEVRLPIHKTS